MNQIIPQNFEIGISIDAQGNQSLNILYLGCGNLILEKNGEAIMTDPFFSNQGILKMMGKVKTNPKRYLDWKKIVETKIAPSSIKATLVAHTHYDHVMDLPIILHDKFFPKMDTVFGNPFVPIMFQNFTKYGTTISALSDQDSYDPREAKDVAFKWHQVTPHIRFLAIESNHAPHLGNKLFMSRPIKERKFREKFTEPSDKVGAFKWTVGDTYSFLVDFIAQDTLRVFIQTSASNAPNGLPPPSELKKKKIDLAILCYASAPNVENYPNFLLDIIQPTKTILVHWEDFFQKPNNAGKLKMVRGTNRKKVQGRLEDLKKEEGFFVMPKPETLIKVSY